jgi:ABC-type lipoprotein export system ATPase subunit
MNYRESIKPLIHIQDVSHTYTGHDIFSHITLDTHRGDISILRWPSGSGKSTFLRILTGIDIPSSGSVGYEEISTRDCWFGTFYREHIWVFFTDSVFFESSTARENIMFPSLFWDYIFSEEVFDACVETLEVWGLLDTPIARLSSWERERIALIRMLVSAPDILILDEPFSHLDERLHSIALGFLSRYITMHHATLWVVTHDRGFALDGANEYRLDSGSLIRL